MRSCWPAWVNWSPLQRRPLELSFAIGRAFPVSKLREKMGHGNAWSNRCISSRSFDYVRCGGLRSDIFVVIGRNDLSGNAQMSLVVMKFGGTSVEDPAAIERTASIVAGRVS